MLMIQSVEVTNDVEGNSNFMMYSNTIVHLESDEGKLLSVEEQKDLQTEFEMVKKMTKAQTLEISLLKQKGINHSINSCI